MKHLVAMLGIGALIGCGPASTQQSPNGPQNPNQEENPYLDLRPTPSGKIGRALTFERKSVAEAAASPVAAYTEEGVWYAYIDRNTRWPVLRSPEGEVVTIPEIVHEHGAKSLTMVASIDGALHLAFELDTAIYYTHRTSEGSFSQLAMIEPYAAKEPTLALSQMGALVLAYTFDVSEALRRAGNDLGGGLGEPERIMVRRGVLQDRAVVFSDPQHANPDCCVDDLADKAHTVSGPSLAVDAAGTAHIVYEWMTDSTVTIEYLNDQSGRFQAHPLAVTNVGFFPCPAIGVDAQGVHITYLEAGQEHAWYVRVVDGEMSSRQSIYQANDGHIFMVMMMLDSDGERHFTVHEETWGDDAALRILHVATEDNELQEPQVSLQFPVEGSLQMTPRAGGAMIAPDGRLRLAFELTERPDAHASANILIGIPVSGD